MQKYELKQSSKSPAVLLNQEKGEMFLGGRSIPDNALELFGPMLDWASKYIEEPQKMTKITFDFEYYNTASSKSILEFLLIMNELQKKHCEIKVFWHYKEDDDDMMEEGEVYSDIVNIPFEFVAIPSNKDDFKV